LVFNPEIAKRLELEITTALKNRLKAHGHVATGRGLSSLKTRIRAAGDGLIIAIIGEEYLAFQETGRRAGSFPPVAALERWVKQKGIASEAKQVKRIAFAIAKNMAKIGMHSKGNRIDLSKRHFITNTIENKSTVIQQRLFQMFEKNFDLIVTQFIKDTQTKTIIPV